MADIHPYEDQALLYVLDRLSADERREFEARLAESAELRALLRELEDGTVALAMTAPSRRPPTQIWKRIEAAVTTDRKPEIVIPSFGTNWWRYGWAAAAIFVAGWLLHGFWLSRSSRSAGDSEALMAQPATNTPDPRLIGIVGTERISPPAFQSNTSEAELMGMRRQIVELSNQISQASQSLLQQQAQLLESNRFKVFQLSTAADGVTITNAVSPALQRALFLAMARELGWLMVPQTGPGSYSPGTNPLNVDFVDLRPGSNTFANPSPPQKDEAPPSNLRDADLMAASGNVPGFVAGNNTVLAFDASIAPPGTSLQFWNGNPGNQWSHPIGTTVLGNNTTIVTVPFSAGGGGTLTVTAGNGAGPPIVLGQFPVPAGP